MILCLPISSLLLVLCLTICFCILGSDDWASYNFPLDLHNSRLLAIAAVEHQVPETGEDYAYAAGTGGITLWHSVGLIVSVFNFFMKLNSIFFQMFYIRHESSIFLNFFLSYLLRD